MKNKILFSLFVALCGCQGKDTLVRPHDPQKPVDPVYTLKSTRSGVMSEEIDQKYVLLDQLKPNSYKIVSQILIPLEQKFINKDFIANPENTVGDFSSNLNLYTDALVAALKVKPVSSNALAALDRFVDLTLRNCSRELKGCTKNYIFRMSSGSGDLVIYKANMIGKEIDSCVKNKGNCESLIEQKYRLLMHAKNIDTRQDSNIAFIGSYLEHAMLIEELPTSSFLRKHRDVFFGTQVEFFDPDKVSFNQRCKIVKNFNIWEYSEQESFGGSKLQTSKLFEMAASCDLYDGKGQLTESFRRVLTKLQTETSNNSNGLTFFQRMTSIKQDPEKRSTFLKYFGEDVLNKATTLDVDGRLNSSFYNEYFYVLDRIYNDDLGPEDAQPLLLKMDRSYRELRIAFNQYVKIQLALGMIDTKDYFKELLNQDQQIVTSDKIFSNALENSDSFAKIWRNRKGQFEKQYTAIRAVFEADAVVPPVEKKAFAEISKQVRYLPVTIKLMASYPAMMTMAHFIAVKDGERQSKAWWGGTVKYSAATIYEEMWKGLEKPWFNFSGEQEALNRFYLVYAFDYAVRSDYISIQQDDDTNRLMNHDEKLSLYAQTMIQKYFKSERDVLETTYKNTFLPAVKGHKWSDDSKTICDYELNPSASVAPTLTKNIEDLPFQIHSGIAQLNTSTNYAMPGINFFAKAKDLLIQINDKTNPKLQMMKTLIEIMKKNGLSKDVIAEAEKEYDLTNDFVNNLLKSFGKQSKEQFTCLLRFHLVETFHQYLAYEEEKQYLSATWDRMATVDGLSPTETATAIAHFNNLPGLYQDDVPVTTGNNIDLFSYDRIVDRNTFKYSNFDILVRLKNHLINGTIQNFMTPEIAKIVAEWEDFFPEAMTKKMTIPRLWSITPSQNLEQSDLVKKRDKDTNIRRITTKEKFIRDGIKALSGDVDHALIQWSTSGNANTINNDDLSNWKTAIEVFTYLYILQDRTQDKVRKTQEMLSANQFKSEVTSDEIDADFLVKVTKTVLRLADMNKLDIELASIFNYNSKCRLEQMKDLIVDGGLRETLFPYSYLFETFKTKIGMSSESLDATIARKSASNGIAFADAYLLSLNLNDNKFRVYFSEHDWLEKVLVSQYKTLSQDRLLKIVDLANSLSENRNTEDANIIFSIDSNVGPNGDVKTYSIKDRSRIPIGDNLINPEKLSDMGKYVNKFTFSTQNLFDTENLGKEKMK